MFSYQICICNNKTIYNKQINDQCGAEMFNTPTMNGRKCRNETQQTNDVFQNQKRRRNEDKTKTATTIPENNSWNHEMTNKRKRIRYEQHAIIGLWFERMNNFASALFWKCCSLFCLGAVYERKCGASETMTITKKNMNNETNTTENLSPTCICTHFCVFPIHHSFYAAESSPPSVFKTIWPLWSLGFAMLLLCWTPPPPAPFNCTAGPKCGRGIV